MDQSGAPLAVSISCDINTSKNQSDCMNCLKCLRIVIKSNSHQMQQPFNGKRSEIKQKCAIDMFHDKHRTARGIAVTKSTSVASGVIGYYMCVNDKYIKWQQPSQCLKYPIYKNDMIVIITFEDIPTSDFRILE